MSWKISRKHLSIALAAGTLVAAVVSGPASALPGECEGRLGEAVKFVTSTTDGPIGGPNQTWNWAHPDGKQANPGQAVQYFCNEH